MAKTASDLITIMRNVTGRVDASDPLFTDTIMLQYLNDFIQQLSTQDVRLFKNRTWWEFNFGPTDPNPYPVNLQNIVLVDGQIGASTIEPPAYCQGFYLFWYQDPQDFFRIWPETQPYMPARPTYVLYYNNELLFRNPPDKQYFIKIAAYQVEIMVNPEGLLNQDYLFRYLAYGASLDIFSDFGEMDKYRDVFPAFMRYRALVYARTYQQYQNQRTGPDF